MIDRQRLWAAYGRARDELLAEQSPNGSWIGRLSSSALATATAVSALAIVRERTPSGQRAGLDRLIDSGVRWLVGQQNRDGGWGDTDKSRSNVAATMLAVAALHLAGRASGCGDVLQRAARYLQQQGGIQAVRRRYGKDKTFAVPILTNAALAGMVPWNEVDPLPFEAACVPQRLYRFLRLPVVSYAIPALVAIGQVRYLHGKPLNPMTRLARGLSIPATLRVLERMQPGSGGYLEAVPLTSFVVMALAGSGRADHPVARRGVRFLRSLFRPDGSWPIDTNLATWNTTLAINALAGAGEEIGPGGALDWLLACQQDRVHPFTGAAPGGWGWCAQSGAVPDADDTAGALLALAYYYRSDGCVAQREQIGRAARRGLRWLVDLQNRDGGWPTFCRGWGALPFDRSGTDLTAHALRALRAWQDHLSVPPPGAEGLVAARMAGTVRRSIQRGFAYLRGRQRPDGSWVPLWFGNQLNRREENPVYGTARVLLAYRDLGRIATPPARQGLKWLRAAQNRDGGWGGGGPAGQNRGPEPSSSVEETALALEALLAARDSPRPQGTIDRALHWLCCKVETGQYRESSPIGFYFAKLWYYEALYPLIFTVSALGQAVRQLHPRPGPQPPTRPPDA